MKINIFRIVKDHIGTLQSFRNKKISVIDIFIFYILPINISTAVWYYCVKVPDDVYSISISVFSIFSALLLSVQVAMYGVFRSERKLSGDRILDESEKIRAEDVRKLLYEINANISYLILISCLSVVLFILFFIVKWNPYIESGMLAGIYSHFVLTLAMVLKRSHEVFSSEYNRPHRFDSRRNGGG